MNSQTLLRNYKKKTLQNFTKKTQEKLTKKRLQKNAYRKGGNTKNKEKLAEQGAIQKKKFTEKGAILETNKNFKK